MSNSDGMVSNQEEDSSLVTLKYATFAILSTILAAVLAAISQLLLSPVYGSIPAGIYHEHLTTCIIIFSVLASVTLPRRSARLDLLVLVCTLFSPQIIIICTYFGPRYGPLVAEMLILAPQLFSAINAPIAWAKSGPNRILTSSTTRTLQPFVFIPLFGLAKSWVKWLLTACITDSSVITRRKLHAGAFCASMLALVKPERPIRGPFILWFCVAWPYETVHNMIRDHRLSQRGYNILDARESVTGYVSVIESTQNHMRALRCDHSLLGGVWLPEGQWKDAGIVVPESIYSIFVMLEAVRLMEFVNVKTKTLDRDKYALVIGLGIGTSPSALNAHGINTTAIEIDPVVSHFATTYFDLPPGVTVVNEDVTIYINRTLSSTTRYDHIIHDVFTGGAEPLELFTYEFLLGLKDLLNPKGTIAINFATDIPFGATGQIMSTIIQTFHNCRAFRDQPPILSNTTITEFVNVVIFCSKDTSEWYFRRPIEPDFLRSQTRREHLYPLYEVDLGPIKGSSVELFTKNQRRRGDLKKDQEESALRHWRIMRDVLPAAVWNGW